MNSWVLLGNTIEFQALSGLVGNLSNIVGTILNEQITQNNRLTALEGITYDLNSLTDVTLSNPILN